MATRKTLVGRALDARLLGACRRASKQRLSSRHTGSVSAGLALYDVMHTISAPVNTTCVGLAASMGAVLMCAGAKGKRAALKHARVMIHQPLGGAEGQASDIEITAREIQKLKKELYDIIANHSGQTYEKVWADSDRDYWMTAEEAKAYGMVDEVLTKSK